MLLCVMYFMLLCIGFGDGVAAPALANNAANCNYGSGFVFGSATLVAD
jgi:hypothetical protein